MKRTLRAAGIAAGVVVLIVAVLPFVVDANSFRPLLESSLTRTLGREVRVGNLKLALLSGGVTASDISVAEDPAFSRDPFLKAGSLKLGVKLGTLIFSRKLHVTALTFERPQVALIQSASGEWNYSSLGGVTAPTPAKTASGGQTPLDLSVELVKITGGRFSVRTMGLRSKPMVLEQVDLTVRDFSPGSAFPFTLSSKFAGGGQLKLEGKAGPIQAAEVVRTPWTAALKVSRLDLAGSGLAGASPIAGLITLEGSGESKDAAVTLRGQVQAEKLKLAKDGQPANRTVQFEFAVSHDLRKHSGRLSRGDIRIGTAPASLTGSYAERNDATILDMKLTGSGMAVPELAAMLPAAGVVLPSGSSLQGGTASVHLSIEGPADRPVTHGSVGLENTRLAGFDLGKKMVLIEKLAGMKSGQDTEIRVFKANVRLAPDGAAADDIRLDVPSLGEVTGSGTVSPDKALDFRMRATVRAGGALAVLSNAAVPFVIEGTASQPVFKPDMKSLAKEQVKGVAGKAGGLFKGLLGGKKNQ